MQEELIYHRYPTMRPIKTPAYLTTEVYELISPYIFQRVLEKISLTNYQIHQISLIDFHHRQLKGFVLIDSQMNYHEIVLGYNGQLYINRKLLKNLSIDDYINHLIMLCYDCGAKKEHINMTNLDRLKMEIENIRLSDLQSEVYLAENGLKANDTYQPEIPANKKAIYKTALAILQSIANQPALMQNYKMDDQTISAFSTSIQNRINQLSKTIQQMPDTEEPISYFSLFM